MTAPPAQPRDDKSRHAINLQWLIRLRWGEAAGQALVILLVAHVMEIALEVTALLSLVGLLVASNLACLWWARGRREVEEHTLAALLALDIALLTAMLYLSGGSFNPFNFLYLVHVTLGAVVLRPRWAWALLSLSLACFGALFVVEVSASGPDGHMHHADQMQIHLQGMWVAFAVASVFIVYFVHRISSALGQRDAELARARERTARSEKLASLATLAAGAAHELSTPLSTIALVARESEAALAKARIDAVAEDMRLIDRQVERCRAILDQMSAEAGDSKGEGLSVMPVRALVDAAIAEVERPNPMRILLDGTLEDRCIRVPLSAARRALRGVLDNACDASPPDAEVVIAARAAGDACVLEVRDTGEGMPADVLARAGEPFFTTKEPGAGMGLGLFLARTLAEHLGGGLTIDSRVGEGTRVTLTLPLAAATTRHIAPHGAAAEE